MVVVVEKKKYRKLRKIVRENIISPIKQKTRVPPFLIDGPEMDKLVQYVKCYPLHK